MAIGEIVSYIKENLKSGRSEDLIKKELSSVGWPKLEIENALIAAKTELSKTPETETNPLARNQSKSKFLKETIEQFQGSSDRPKTKPKFSALGLIPLIAIPVVIALGLWWRAYYLSHRVITPKTNNGIVFNTSSTASSTSKNEKLPGEDRTAVFIYPLGGEKWEIGNSYKISWSIPSRESDSEVIVALEQFSSKNPSEPYEIRSISPNKTKNEGTITLGVPQSFQGMNLENPVRGNSFYKIKITTYNPETNKTYSIIESNSFNIVAKEQKNPAPGGTGNEGGNNGS